MLMMTTSYNSDPRQTDDTPFITASGTHVHEGTVATNILPFGTKLKIEGFGDEIFTVEDRMNAKYDGKKMLDIWTANEKDSLDYGARIVTVKIVEI
jgi:3D (Asp-Asp-Asp) domain-containing protein